RSSPSYGVSSPPLKKYVTCGYFSVSATCSWRSCRAAITAPIVVAGRSGANATGYGQPSSYSVILAELVERRRRERQRDLPHPIGPEVQSQHRVAGADPCVIGADQGRRDELVGL